MLCLALCMKASVRSSVCSFLTQGHGFRHEVHSNALTLTSIWMEWVFLYLMIVSETGVRNEMVLRPRIDWHAHSRNLQAGRSAGTRKTSMICVQNSEAQW